MNPKRDQRPGHRKLRCEQPPREDGRNQPRRRLTYRPPHRYRFGKVIEPCKKGYHFKADRNMGKERAEHLREKFGEEDWRKACHTAGKRTLVAVKKDAELTAAKEKATKEAAEHFAMLRARLAARAQAGIDAAKEAAAGVKLEEAIAELANEILANPVVTLDTMGVYILSEKPWWDDPDWDPELAARAGKKSG